MEFTAMDELSYRSLGADEYEQRRSEVIGLAKELPEDATEEQMRSIDAEIDIITAEDERRSAIAEMEERAAKKVVAGAAKPVETAEIKKESEMERAANLGEHFAAYVKERGHEKSFHLVAPAYELRAATDVHTAPQVIEYDRTAFVPPLSTNVLDMFARETIEGNAITYFVQGAMEGAPAVTAEGTAKPQVHFPSEPKTVSLKKIAGIVKESDELIDDARWLASIVNGRLLNELNRVRQSTVITDLLATSGLGTANAAADAASIADAIDLAMMTVMDDTGFDADGIIMTPALWHTLNIGKDSGLDYYGDGYFRAPMARSIWGIPVAVNPAMTANHIVVGSFKGCASLVGKAEGVTVESTNTDTDDFQKNLMTLRAECREVVCVRQPSGFINITVGA